MFQYIRYIRILHRMLVYKRIINDNMHFMYLYLYLYIYIYEATVLLSQHFLPSRIITSSSKNNKKKYTQSLLNNENLNCKTNFLSLFDNFINKLKINISKSSISYISVSRKIT